MKKLIFCAAIILAAASCSANRIAKSPAIESGNPDLSVIEGKWLPNKPAEVMLFGVRNGQLEKIASSVPDGNNNFYFAFVPSKESFYVVGLNTMTPMNNYMFYFKPGDKLNFVIDGEKFELVGNNTPENREMERWHNWLLPLETKSIYYTRTMSTYEDFFPLLEEKVAEGFTPAATGNKVFDDAFVNFSESYFTTVLSNFILTPRTKHPQANDFPAIYKSLTLKNVATAQFLDYPYAISLLNSFPLLYQSAHRAEMTDEQRMTLSSREGSIEFITSVISDPVLKGEYFLSLANKIRTYEGYLDFEKKHSDNFVTEEQKAAFKRLLKDIPIPENGAAIDFKFADKDGNMVALSDFKGKVVYIDVWATWCGPCLAQIPPLKKLEAEYHDNPNIVFMSVSADKTKDHQKWLDLIAKEELGGVQLFGGDYVYQNLMTPYKISGIPRFMLVGKDGNLINIEAPRPSSDEIRPLLEAALKK